MKKAKLQERYGLFINGEWRDASNGDTFTVTSPADGSVSVSYTHLS